MKTFKQFLINEAQLEDVDIDKLFLVWKNNESNYDNMETWFYMFKYDNSEYEDMEDDEIESLPVFQDYFRTKYEGLYDEFVWKITSIMNSNQGYIPIYRNMTVADDFIQQLNIKKQPRLGIYWSWDENTAESHWGHGNHKLEIQLHSLIHNSHVDWWDTILLNLNTALGDTEKEIRLFKNTPIQILKIIDTKTDEELDISTIENKTFKA